MLNQRLTQIKKFYYKHKRLPSYAEMLKIFKLSSKKSIFDIVHKLIENGLINKEGKKLAPTKEFFRLPVLGLVKAGYPILADETRDYLSLDEYLIEDPHTSFLLREGYLGSILVLPLVKVYSYLNYWRGYRSNGS